MSCCDSSPTKLQFLIQKAQNFKKYVESFNPDSEIQAYIASFNEENLSSTIMTVVCPIIASGQLDSAAEQLVSHLTISGCDKEKIKAYMKMFNDVLLE